ncbi:MAG TPA: hypothetical protein PLP25_00765 [Candidatus Limiplasma sp.]|nr:hypothetical protein [Candidatus Limiplasma sp.]HPS80375.1 hypothetical protein [Candidatus Limiplasma sp.]
MKRALCLAAALCLFASAAFAQPATEAAPLTGERLYPEGADAATASYVFSYAYPQFTGEGDGIAAINAYYASMAKDTANAAAPDEASLPDALPADGSPAYYTQIDYRVTANTDDYLSVLISSRQFLGNTETENWSANVFAQNGVYVGQPLSLSQVMGLEQEDGASASGNSYAADLVYGLVWQIVQQQQAMQQRDYFAELTQADLEQVFTPESDFYLDGDNNLVFYIQPGAIASEVEGVLTFPFSVAELLSAVKP